MSVPNHTFCTRSGGMSFMILLFLLLPSGLIAQKSAPSSEADTTGHPNTIPYSSGRSVGEHILAFPSYLLHWATRPIGYGIKYAEQELPHLFEGERGPYGFFPIFESGGEAGFAGGLLLYHDHLFRENHRARAEILFGSRRYNEFDLEYHIPLRPGQQGTLSLYSTYENNPSRTWFLSSTSANRASYTSELGSVALEYQQSLTKRFSARWTAGYRNITIRQSEHFDDDIEFLMPEPLKGQTELLSVGTRWNLDLSRGQKRTLSGSRYKAGIDWLNALAGSPLSYLNYQLEWHYFRPLGFLPDTRRIGFRARLNKNELLSGRQVPFFDQPALGGSRDLRGFPSNRFRADGTLLLTLEYRYPVWNFADVTLFIDEGQPFDRFGDIRLNNFHRSYGFGFHLLSSGGLAFRTEFAFSRETSRFILSITPNF